MTLIYWKIQTKHINKNQNNNKVSKTKSTKLLSHRRIGGGVCLGYRWLVLCLSGSDHRWLFRIVYARLSHIQINHTIVSTGVPKSTTTIQTDRPIYGYFDGHTNTCNKYKEYEKRYKDPGYSTPGKRFGCFRGRLTPVLSIRFWRFTIGWNIWLNCYYFSLILPKDPKMRNNYSEQQNRCIDWIKDIYFIHLIHILKFIFSTKLL